MKNTRLILALAAVCALAPSVFAPSFAVLLGSGPGDTESQDADHKNWIDVQSIAWTPAAASDGATAKGVAPTESTASGSAKGIARREYEPVVLTIPAEGKSPALKKAFKKGRKLGTIRLRDGERVLVLHDVVVANVTRTGATESIALNYTKIENDKVPERAKARIKAGESGKAP